MNFVAAWRVFERTLNPAFYFIIKCGKCGQNGTAQFVKSTTMAGTLIGMECSNCGQTLKFARKIGLNDPDFPSRLEPKPQSVLIDPDGKQAESGGDDVELLTELMFPDE